MMKTEMRMLTGTAVLCTFALAAWGAYCVGHFVGDTNVSSSMSRSHQVLFNDLLDKRHDATWSVKGVEDAAFVLNNPHGTILFRFGSCTLAEDALESIRNESLASGWFIVPQAMSKDEKGGRAVLIGNVSCCE